MKPSRIRLGLGIVLIAFGIYALIQNVSIAAFIPILIGVTLTTLGFVKGRVATLIFGHACIVIGAYLITWGILLLPYSKPGIAYIFGRPLFWGIFCLMGGICAIFHGFCRCVTKQVDMFEQGIPVKK
jgi:uncharacterized membrane protein HdeD (DUF308 family)